MCNAYKLTRPVDAVASLFSNLGMPLAFPEGAPNVEPREMVRITDPAPIVRRIGDAFELVQRRWSWPGPGGKPVYNFRSEGRRFGTGRCLIPVDGFYEYTAPEAGEKRKTRWLFTMPGEAMFCIAGLVRPSPAGEAFTMLTMPPGPDVAPFHDRQVAALSLAGGRAWLEGASEGECLRTLPEGSFTAERA